jgi:hypothetical protein
MNKLSLMVSMLAVIFTAGYGHSDDRRCTPRVVVTRAPCVRGILPRMRVVERPSPPVVVQYVYVERPVVVQYQRAPRRCEERTSRVGVVVSDSGWGFSLVLQ